MIIFIIFIIICVFNNVVKTSRNNRQFDRKLTTVKSQNEIYSDTSSIKLDSPEIPKKQKTHETSMQWFEGGNLHNTTWKKWKKATYRNKLATAGDWLTATKWKGHLNSHDDFDKLKKKARLLVTSIDEMIEIDDAGSLDSMSLAEAATLLVLVSPDFDP